MTFEDFGEAFQRLLAHIGAVVAELCHMLARRQLLFFVRRSTARSARWPDAVWRGCPRLHRYLVESVLVTLSVLVGMRLVAVYVLEFS